MPDALHSRSTTARSPRRPIWEREAPTTVPSLTGELDALSGDFDGPAHITVEAAADLLGCSAAVRRSIASRGL
jgi:hypothetical protein